MKKAKILSDYLTFTRKERIGLLVLITLIGVIWTFPAFIKRYMMSEIIATDTSWMAAINTLVSTAPGSAASTADWAIDSPS